MAANRRLDVTEFDFDDVKANLKTFLKAQTEFKDYDFEGSGMNILLDTLAYNTHYLGFNMNMLANEMFMDSSSLRSKLGKARTPTRRALGSKFSITSSTCLERIIAVTGVINSNSVSLIPELISG